MSQNPFLTTRATMIMGGVTALSAIATDIFLPATGVIARDYGVTEAYGAWLIGAYFIAYGIGQLFWGLFSDAYGRKFALQLSLAAFTVTSIACAFAPSFSWLIALRILQGLSAGAPVICRAMVRDVATGKDAARILAVLAAVLTVATMIAPIMGSGLLILFHWPALFIVLALFAAGYIAYTAPNLPETARDLRPQRFSFGFVIPNAAKLFANKGFSIPMLQGGLIFAGYASLLSIGAVLTETVYQVSPEAFGSLFAFTAISNTAGALATRRLLVTHSLKTVNTAAVTIMGLAALASLGLAMVTPSLALFWAVTCFYVFGFGIILPTSAALAMDYAGDTPGFAAALNGSVLVTLGALGSAFSAVIYTQSHHAVPITMSACAALALLLQLAKSQR